MSISIEELGKMPLFAHCTDEDINRFITCVRPTIRQYEPNEILHNQDEPLAGIFLLTKGRLTVARITYSGAEAIIDELLPGDIYGQLAAFGANYRNNSLLRAADYATCLLFPSESFYHTCSTACRSHQLVIRNMLGLVVEQANRLSEKVNYLSSTTLKGKIARFLLAEAAKHPKETFFDIHQNRESLARTLAVARPSLSRSLTQLRDDGLIDFDRNTFRIIDAEALEALE